MTETTQGFDQVRALLGPDALSGLMREILLGAGEVVRGFVAVYPQKPLYPLKWQSAKQRRWYWANVNAGKLEVPYRRQQSPTSQRLGPSWLVRVDTDTTGYVETHVTYAAWVQGADAQQLMHAATGWVTDAEAVQRAGDSGDIDEVFAQAFAHWVGGQA